jgi:hypothetical protein
LTSPFPSVFPNTAITPFGSIRPVVMDPWAYWTKHEDDAFVSAAVRVDAQGYFISIQIDLH